MIQADAANVADVGMVADGLLEPAQQVGPDPRRVLDQPLLLHDLQIREADRAANRMARVGEAMHYRSMVRRGGLDTSQMRLEITDADTGKYALVTPLAR